MRTEYLKTALKVMELGSLLKTSKLLKLTSQGISHQIEVLEDELGFELFKPSDTKGTPHIPTQQGRVYLLWASQALAMLEEGRLEAIEAGPRPERFGKGGVCDEYV